jgi:hypothetical protein
VSQLYNIVRFVDVAGGATVALPHGLNIDTRPITPDLIAGDIGGFTATADDTVVSVTNTTAGPLSINVWCEHEHTRQRFFGAVAAGSHEQVQNLVPQPFVLMPGGGGAVGTDRSMLAWGNRNIGAAADARFLVPGRDNPSIATTVDVMQWPLVEAGHLMKLFVRHNSANGNGNDVVYTVLLNGAPTAITATLASGAVGQVSDLVNTGVAAQGDRVSLRATKAAGIGSGQLDVQASLEVMF